MATQPISDLRKHKTFFAARDALDRALDAGELVLTGPQNALFRYLLEHAWYNPKDPEDFGYVIESALDYEKIARRLGVNEKTIRRALPVLDDMGLTERWNRPLLTGGKDPDAIRVTWLLDTESASDSDTESASDSDTESASDPGTESGSSFTQETNQETSSRPDDDVAAPSAGTSKPQGKVWLAGHLGVTPSEIGAKAVILADRLRAEYGDDVVAAAAQEAAYRAQTTRAGYFLNSAESFCARLAAERQLDAQAGGAAAEQHRVAAEIESWLPRFSSVGMTERHFHGQLRIWRDEKCLSNETILTRMPQWLEKATARHAQEQAADAAHAEGDQIADAYEQRFHGGNTLAATRYVYAQAGGRKPDALAFMPAALAQGTNDPSQVTVS